MNRGTRFLWWMLLASWLSACGNLSGLDGSSRYACKAPPGVSCQSVSAVYANGSTRPTAADGPVESPPSLPAVTQQPSLLGAPLRSPPRILRLWFKPWVDSDNDLYDQGYVYVHIDNGHWLVDGAQNRIRAAYAPRLQAPRSTATTATPRPARPAPSNPLPTAERQVPEQPSAGDSP